jgi:hypothetical protein
MPNYGTGVLATPAAASGAPFYTFHTAARRARIYKMKNTASVANIATSFELFRASNTPVATTSTTPQPYDAADAAATAALDTAWSTPPTVPANNLGCITYAPAQGAGETDVWQSDKEITLATATWLVGWNGGAVAGPALSVTIVYDE